MGRSTKVKKMARMRPPIASMRIDAYAVVQEWVERGVIWGIRRHYKHRDRAPSEEQMQELADDVSEYVMTSLCEVIRFEDGCDEKDHETY